MADLFNTCSQVINDFLSTTFKKLGRICGTYPKSVLLTALLCAFALATGFIDFTQEGRPEKLFNPTGVRAVEDREDYEQYFGSNARPENILIRSIENDGDVLTKLVLLSAWDFWEGLQDINATEEVDDVFVQANSKCVPLGPLGCWTSSVLSAWPNRAALASDTNITGTVIGAFSNEQIKSFIGFENNVIDFSKARILNFFFLLENEPVDRKLGGTNVNTDLGADALELEMLDYALDESAPWIDQIEVIPRLIQSFTEEIGGAIVADVPLQAASWMLIIFYVIIMVQTKCDLVESSYTIGVCAVVTVLLGILSGFGLAQLLNIPYGNTHSVLPFIILGIGADSSFIILSTFRQTDASLSLAERASKSLGHAGVSITVTSLTNVSAFAIGSLTAIPDLSSFCKYAALAQLFLYIFQNTFFISAVVLNEKRIQQRRFDVLCCCKRSKKREEEYNGAYQQSRISWFLANKYAPVLLDDRIRPLILILCTGFIGWMSYNITQLTVEATGNNFLPDGSYLKLNIDLTSQFFGGVPTDVELVLTDFDYFAERADLYVLADAYREVGFSVNPPYIDPDFDFWFDELLTSMQVSSVTSLQVDVSVGGLLFPTSSDNFYAELNNWLTLNPDRKSLFAFTNNNSKIVRSLIRMQHLPIGELDSNGVFQEDADEVIKAVDKMYEITDNLGVDAYPTAQIYSTDWASYAIIQDELVRNSLYALASVLIVTTVLIGHPVTSFFVFISVCITIVELLGMQVVAGLFIDTVVVVLVVLAIGLSVDYAAHIGHCFMLKNGTRKERVTKALEDIGAPVLNGATSTFIAILLQAFSQSYVFRVVFFDFFFAIVFGAFNGLVLLPIVLSYIGPAAYSDDIEQKEIEPEKAIAARN